MPNQRRRTAPPGGALRSLFVDSSAWIALLSARDQHHTEADALIRQALARGVTLVTTNLVLAEVHRLLLHRAGRRAAIAALVRVEDSKRLTLEFATPVHHERARAWIARLADQDITYTDAVSFAVMDARGCTTAFTFDHDFVVAGFARWILD